MPGLEKPEQVYALMAQDLLPAGLIGLTVAGMLSHAMAMASSDANAVSAVGGPRHPARRQPACPGLRPPDRTAPAGSARSSSSARAWWPPSRPRRWADRSASSSPWPPPSWVRSRSRCCSACSRPSGGADPGPPSSPGRAASPATSSSRTSSGAPTGPPPSPRRCSLPWSSSPASASSCPSPTPPPARSPRRSAPAATTADPVAAPPPRRHRGLNGAAPARRPRTGAARGRLGLSGTRPRR